MFEKYGFFMYFDIFLISDKINVRCVRGDVMAKDKEEKQVKRKRYSTNRRSKKRKYNKKSLIGPAIGNRGEYTDSNLTSSKEKPASDTQPTAEKNAAIIENTSKKNAEDTAALQLVNGTSRGIGRPLARIENNIYKDNIPLCQGVNASGDGQTNNKLHIVCINRPDTDIREGDAAHNAKSASNFDAIVDFIIKRARAFCDEKKFDNTQLLNSDEIGYVIRKFIKDINADASKNCADAIISFINPKTQQTLLHYFLEQICSRAKSENTFHLLHIVSFLYHIKLQSKTSIIIDTKAIHTFVKSQYKKSAVFSDLFNLMEKDKFLSSGAEVNKRTKFLKYCIQDKYNEAVLMLSQDQTNLIYHIQDQKGFTPLYYAMKMGKYAFAELLLRHGAPAYLLNYYNRNIFHIASELTFDVCMRPFYAFCSEKRLINKEDSLQITPLYYACTVGNLELVNYLIEKQANVQFVGYLKSNALLVACKFQNIKLCVSLLSSHPHLINSVDSNGSSPLHQAVFVNNIELVNILINKGADYYAVDNFGQNILHIACCTPNNNIVERFFGAYREIFYTIATQIDNNGLTPIHYLIEKCNLQVIFYLLHQGVNIEGRDKFGRTPLHYLMYKQKHEKAKTILNQCKEGRLRINLDIPDNNGMTLLNLAVHFGELELTSLLIRMGANLYIANNFGHTPLQNAQMHKERANMLKNSDAHCRNYQSIIDLISGQMIEQNRSTEYGNVRHQIQGNNAMHWQVAQVNNYVEQPSNTIANSSNAIMPQGRMEVSGSENNRLESNEDEMNLVERVRLQQDFLDPNSNFTLGDSTENALAETDNTQMPFVAMSMQNSGDFSSRSM